MRKLLTFIFILSLSFVFAESSKYNTFSLMRDKHFSKEMCESKQCIRVYFNRHDITTSIDDSHLYIKHADFIYPKLSVYEEKPVFILVTATQKSDIFGYNQFISFLTKIPVMLKEATTEYSVYSSKNPISNGILGSYTPDEGFLKNKLDEKFLLKTGKHKGQYCFLIPKGDMYEVPDSSSTYYYPVDPCS